MRATSQIMRERLMSDFEKWSKYNLGYTGREAFEGGQQSKEAALKECDEVIKLQDADLRKYEKQIESLKAQLNNMEACYIEKKKQVDACAALAAGWSAITWDKTTHWTEGYEEGCYHCSGQIEEALRGAND